MAHRILPADTSAVHPFGPRPGVPSDMADSEKAERERREEDERYGSSSAVIPGVRFEDGHPLDLRTPADLGIVRHAVRSRWPISDEMKQVIADTMMTIVKGAHEPRDKINAAKVIVAGDRINSREEVPNRLDVTVNVRELSDADLEAQLAAIEEEERRAARTIAVIPPPPPDAAQD